MKLIIEVVEGQQGEEGNRSIGGYVITTRVVVEKPDEAPHEATNLPWLAVIFVVALQHELRRAFGDPNSGATFVIPPGARDPVGTINQAMADRQNAVKAEQDAGDIFPDEMPE